MVFEVLDRDPRADRRVDEGEALGVRAVEQINQALLLPRRPRLAVKAGLPLLLRNFRVEFVDIRQWLAGLLRDRFDRLAVVPVLQQLVRRQRQQPGARRDRVFVAVGPVPVDAFEQRSLNDAVVGAVGVIPAVGHDGEWLRLHDGDGLRLLLREVAFGLLVLFVDYLFRCSRHLTLQ